MLHILSLTGCLRIQEGHLDVVKFLFENDAEFDHADKNWETPLWIASQVCFFFVSLSFFKYESKLRIVELACPFGDCRVSVCQRR